MTRNYPRKVEKAFHYWNMFNIYPMISVLKYGLILGRMCNDTLCGLNTL